MNAKRAANEHHSRDALIVALQDAGAVFHGNKCRCIFHDDKRASAGVYEQDGVWRFKCHSCDASGDVFDIRARIRGVPLADVLPKGDGKPPTLAQRSPARTYATLEEIAQAVKDRVEATYRYRDDFAVIRSVLPDGSKTFSQVHREAELWTWGAPPKPWPIYNSESIGDTEDPVIAVEGEKCVEKLRKIGMVAVTSPCGAGKAACADWTPLANRDVVLWPDNDEPGRAHMVDVAAILAKLPAAHVHIIEPSRLGLPAKGDCADFLEARATDSVEAKRAAILEIVASAPEAETPCFPWQTLPDGWLTAHVPARDFVFHNALPVGCVSLLLATGGGGKSTLALTFALSVATGMEILKGFAPTQRGCVAIVSLEDDMSEIQRRLQRIARAHGLGEYDEVNARENLRFLPVATFQAISNGTGALCPGVDLLALRDALVDFGPRLVVLDPLAALLGGACDENDNADAQAIVGIIRDAMPADAGVLLAAHVSKAEKDLSFSARGASAWSDAARCVLALRPLDAKEGKNVAEPRDFVALEMRKSNYAAMRPPIYLRRDTGSSTAGALSVVDFNAMKTETSFRQEAAVRDAVLAVLPTLDEEGITRREATGKSKTAAERGQFFRDSLKPKTGFEVSCVLLGTVIEALLRDGALCQTQQGKRMILTLPTNGNEAATTPEATHDDLF